MLLSRKMTDSKKLSAQQALEEIYEDARDTFSEIE